MKNKLIIAVIVAAVLPLSYPLYVYHQKNITLPFKCLYTTEYTDVLAGESITVSLTHDLRIYSEGQDYFILNGKATYNNVTYRVARTVLLKSESEIEGKTFRFNADRTVKLPSDNVPEPLMDNILQEYEVTPESLQIDIFPLSGKTYLIGGPYAFVSVCLRY